MHLGGLVMSLTKYALGELLELVVDTNQDLKYGPDAVKGMTITKEIIPTKANVNKTDLSKFLIVQPKEFIYNPRTHGKKIGFGYNNSKKSFIISWNNIAFRVKPSKLETILPDYLFLHFKRDEWDREACFQSWGSSTEVFSWDTLCSMTIEVPSISIQQKYANTYNAMLQNQQCYELGINNLKLTCDAYIENLRHSMVSEEIGNYIVRKNDKNTDNKIQTVLGLSTSKEFRVPQSRVNKKDLGGYKIVNPFEFAFVPTTDTWKVLAFAINTYNEPIVVSPIYEVFSVRTEKLLPEYLALWLSRDEFDRYARFHSWGSARENFSWEAMCEVRIPIPDIDVQHSIVDIYKAYNIRKEINEKLKAQLKDICPILIKGSIEEAKN